MKTLNAGISSHIAGSGTKLSVCWKIVRRDGVEILGTEHSRDIKISAGSPVNPLAGTYERRAGITGSDVRSTSDLSVDNLEVTGATASQALQIDISAADIEAGLFDNADCTTFLVNHADPDGGQIILRTGTIGNITRTSEGEYKTELRGLTQALSQTIVRTYGVSCDAELGDSRCTLSLASLTHSATVTGVTSRRVFTATITGSPNEADLAGGKATFLTGNNANYQMEIKSVSAGVVTLYMPMPLTIQIGDTLDVQEACDKSPTRCKALSNFVNFRGHALFVPGETEILLVGGQ